MNEYFSGDKLYGDDYDLPRIYEWYRDEENGYADLGAKNKKNYHYDYHALNSLHCYKILPKNKFEKALGFGSAYGDELYPIINQLNHITILEPSEVFSNTDINGIPIDYIKPNPDGKISFDDNSFDIITCFGVLHHIPNVSKVISELYRVLKPGGYLLIREPTVSMGDWTKPRIGVTKRERGIPVNVFDSIISQNQFKILYQRRCDFSLTSKLNYFIKGSVYNSKSIVILDKILCRIFCWNKTYHATNFIKKLRPCSKAYVLSK